MSILVSLYVIFGQSFILRFFSNNLGRTGCIKLIQLNFFIIISINIIFFFSCILAQDIPYQYLINFGCWFHLHDLTITWLFSIDSLSVTMSLLVLIISGFVHLYSVTYLKVDPYLIRFLSYLSLFTGFMLLMVLSLNLVVFFFGWEGIGLCSYLLISFWYTRVPAVKAALKALFVNRIGDFFFLVGASYCFRYLKTLDIDLILLLIPYFTTIKVVIFGKIQVYLVNIISFCFSMAAIGKSAQLGLHIWLPDAMEGPTPVSALIHAATMVTAGIFLLLRLSGLLVFSTVILNFLVILGALTAFICAIVATVQFDIKKIIAYSTCSQLGYMVLAIGLTNFHGSYYHLLNHAFFKALLFLTAGAIIHSLSGEQDIRKMGGLVKILPFYYFCFLISSLSMIGFFFFSGFYSKEFILNSASLFSSTQLVLFSYWLSILTTVLTAFYSSRLIYEVFFGTFRGHRRVFYEMLHRKTFIIPNDFKYILLFLAILSIFSGYLLKNLFMDNSLFFSGILPITTNLMITEYLPFWIKLIPIFSSLFGIFIFIFYYDFYIRVLQEYKSVYALFLENFFFSSLLNWVSAQILFSARTLFFIFDKGILEILGPSGIYYVSKYVSISIFRIYSYDNFFYQLILLCVGLLGFLFIILFIGF